MSRPKPDYETALNRILARCLIIEDGCHIWPGAVSGFGYPVANVNGRGTYTYLHRAVWQLHNGEIPEGFEIDHACNNTFCLNPLHLQALTHGENVKRGGCGVRRTYEPSAALYYRKQGWSLAQIADKFGVSESSIKKALYLVRDYDE